ncbi:hypothetical protein QFC22_003214 [Naganishia vaughanmartiniae]|uniref:Uncharacterized protein n=1 Tax=Naganishia vaughanmartiniae TaxID=1424756 RepID=A0ACC2X7U4_9TREE|nr:hypothetical protein QFC22_003214 [Naganishia vaughanmartiniae]
MPFPYKKILVIGATSGIGEDLAARILKEAPESKVIAVGRRQEKLDDFVKKHGAERSTGVKFDITDLDEIPAFAERNTNEHKDLDMIILNSGIQRGLDFANPESIDLSSIDLEMRTNYFSYIHLLKAFLPVLQAKKEQTALVFMTSGLALAPLSRCGNYCATKAALHSLIMSLRFQLEQSGKGDIKVIEILPPAVQSSSSPTQFSFLWPFVDPLFPPPTAELHDAKHQPDISNGGSIGMPLNEFTDEAWAGLTEGKDEIPVGMTKMGFEKLEPIRKMVFEKMNSQFKH